jgi:hypothetical protein
VIVDPPMFLACVDLTGLFQIVNIVPQGLLIARQFFQITVFNELLFQYIVDG